MHSEKVGHFQTTLDRDPASTLLIDNKKLAVLVPYSAVARNS